MGSDDDLNPFFLGLFLLPSLLVRLLLLRRGVYVVELFLFILMSLPFFLIMSINYCADLSGVLLRDRDPMMFAFANAWVSSVLLLLVGWVRAES
jgi:hypothetical protein